MNERIKELAIKAGLDFDGYGYPIGGSCEDEKKEFLEKFAELIIRDQQRKWVGLTESEMGQFIHDHCQQTDKTYRSLMDFASMLNDCLIRKNT